MIDKPRIGGACNGCGLCCKTQVCINGAYVQRLVSNLGETVKIECPALVRKNDGTYACGIVLEPTKYIKNSKYPASVLSRNFAHLIGSGSGCDELDEDSSEEEERNLEDIIIKTKNDPQWFKRTRIALKVIHQIDI